MLVAVAGVSTVGDLMSSVAIAAYLLEHGSATWVAAYFVAGLSARTLGAPFGGRVVDRLGATRVLVGANVTSAVLFAITAVAVAAGAGIGWILAITTLAALVAGVHRPALAGIVPRVVPDERLESANAALAATQQVAWIVGPAVGAVLALWWTTSGVVLVNAVTFVAAALLTSALTPNRRIEAATTDRTDQATRHALRCVLTTPLLAGAGLMIVFGAENVVQPLVTRDRWYLDPASAGLLVTAAGIGGLAGAPFAASSVRRFGPLRSLSLAVSVTLAVFAGIVVAPSMAWGLGLSVVAGGFGVIYDVAAATLVQRAVPAQALGWAFGLLEVVDGVAQLSGIVLAPVLIGLLGLGAGGLCLAGLGSVLLLVALVVARGQRSQIARTIARGGEQHDDAHQQAGSPPRQVLTAGR